MDAKAPVNGGAINAKKDPIRYRRPRRILGVAIEAHLVLGPRSELLKDGVFIGNAIGRHRIPKFRVERRKEGF